MSTEHVAVKALVDELSAALADMAEALQEGQANVGEIGATLAEMLELARKGKEAAQITVNVPPAAPAQFVVVPQTDDFKITHEYDSKGRLVASHVHRQPKGAT